MLELKQRDQVPSAEGVRVRARAGSGPQESNSVDVKMRAPAGDEERGLGGTGKGPEPSGPSRVGGADHRAVSAS